MNTQEKQIATYGMTREEIIADFKDMQKLYRENDYIYIMGILSDAQMEMEMGHNNTARQFINKAKLLISYNKDKGVA